MKICYIGAVGHIKHSIKYFKNLEGAVFAGFAPSCRKENITAPPDPSMPWFDDYKTMLDTVKPDLAVVSPVFNLTGSIIIECANRKIDVFSEKPIASTLSELEAVKTAVNDSEIRFCAMHYLRYTPSFYHAASMVKGGAVGNIKMITAQKSYKYGNRPEWYSDPALYGSSATWVGIHALDWIYNFTGKAFTSVTTLTDGNTPEKAMLLQLTMSGGIIASVNIDYYRPKGAKSHGDDRVRCVGDKGIIEVDEQKIILMDTEGTKEFFPESAPDLLDEFLFGEKACTKDEIFHITKTAILAKESKNERMLCN